MQENTHTKALLECIEPKSTILFWNDRKHEEMPYAFMKKKGNFSKWFNNQKKREKITQRFENELLDGLVTDIYLNKIRQSWSHESHYQALINWYKEEHLKTCKFYNGKPAPDEPSRMGRITQKYPFLEKRVLEGTNLSEDEQSAWEEYLFMANEIEKGRIALKTIESYCNAALWFIRSSKNIVENWENVKIANSTDASQEEKKGGRKKDPEVQKRNLDIFNDYRKRVDAEGLNDADALDRVYKSYKKSFTGEPKNIKDQIRRIIKATQSGIS